MHDGPHGHGQRARRGRRAPCFFKRGKSGIIPGTNTAGECGLEHIFSPPDDEFSNVVFARGEQLAGSPTSYLTKGCRSKMVTDSTSERGMIFLLHDVKPLVCFICFRRMWKIVVHLHLIRRKFPLVYALMGMEHGDFDLAVGFDAHLALSNVGNVAPSRRVTSEDIRKMVVSTLSDSVLNWLF